MKEIRDNIHNYLKGLIAKKIGDDDEPIDTDIDLETNVTKNTKLSPFDLVARQLTENPDDMLEKEEEMSLEELTITGNYSDCDILEEENETINKNDDVLVNTKK